MCGMIQQKKFIFLNILYNAQATSHEGTIILFNVFNVFIYLNVLQNSQATNHEGTIILIDGFF